MIQTTVNKNMRDSIIRVLSSGLYYKTISGKKLYTFTEVVDCLERGEEVAVTGFDEQDKVDSY